MSKCDGQVTDLTIHFKAQVKDLRQDYNNYLKQGKKF